MNPQYLFACNYCTGCCYYCDYWFGAPMPWVDPMKDMQSTKLEIEMGLTTRSRVLAAVGVE
jgi:capsid protein